MQADTVTIQGETITTTDLERPLFPAGQFTKGKMVEFYVHCAPFILPHLRNRPVTLKRYPDGVFGEPFWEKDAPSFTPAWVRTVAVPRKLEPGNIHYIVVDDLKTLVWCAAVATIEFHPFLHCADNLEQPQFVVFDLDPGEGADVLTCADAAFQIRQLLAKLKLKCWPKVSGSKGIQVHVPLNTATTYQATRPFAQAVAQLLAQQHPDTIVADMTKSLRRGKVFIDWSQNMETKTTVGVYSMRAKHPQPFISMPVEWDELRRALRKSDANMLYFSPDAAIARLRKLGDLHAPVLKLKQTLPLFNPEAMEPRSKRLRAKALEPYSAKRNFRRTHEPTADAPRRAQQGGRRRYVIQKHAASHLHYDLRLEIGDTLKSWSIPKGMPLKIEEARTAIAVEDHPLDYLQFEGVIPQGQYGGGTVMVWDIGTYEVIDGNYWKGRLHLFFSGRKLKGEWLLERKPDSPAEKPVWVVTKLGQDARPISAKRDDSSALTGRAMDEIAEARDAQWRSNRPNALDSSRREKAEHLSPASAVRPAKSRRIPEPEFASPMLARVVDKLPSGAEWSYEIKWDGYRVEAIKHGNRTRLLSRKGRDITATFPGIRDAVSRLNTDTAILDGEVVAVDGQGRPSFQQLQNRAKLPRGWKIVYYAFDLLNLDGTDLKSLPLTERKAKLQALVHDSDVLFSPDLNGTADAVVAAARKLDLEGVLAKRRSSRYEPGKRSGAWVKLPLKPKQEFVIGGFRPGGGTFQLLLVGYYEHGKFLFAGKVRQGLNRWNRQSVYKVLKPLQTIACPFANLPNSKTDHFGETVSADEMADYIWVKPQVVAEIKFTEWTDGGVLRHGEFAGIRDDKEPRDVVRETRTDFAR